MKLYALCWQDPTEPWGWAPAVSGEDDDLPQTFFWIKAVAEAALEDYLEKVVVPCAVERANKRIREVNRRIEERNANWRRHVLAGRSLPGITIRRPTMSPEGDEMVGIAPEALLPEVTADDMRAEVRSEWTVMEYEVPDPPKAKKK